MLTPYIEAAMKRAAYEAMEEDNTVYGEIPGFQGVWANANTEAECRVALQSALKDWILFRLSRGLTVPIGVDVVAVE